MYSQTTFELPYLSSGIVGMSVNLDGPLSSVSVINSAPQAKQVKTVTISSAVDDTDYTNEINGVDVTYNSGASSSTSTIAIGLADTINATASVRSTVSAVRSGATVVVTALQPGTSFTLTESSGNMTTADTTAAATANTVPFGVGIVKTGVSTVDGLTLLGTAAASSLFSAQVDSYAVTYDASVEIWCEVIVDGESYSAPFTMATDAATSVEGLKTAINAVLPSNSVIATRSSDTLVLTSEVVGKPFTSRVFFGVGRDTGAAVKTSNASSATDATLAFVGVSEFERNIDLASFDDTDIYYAKNSVMRVKTKGEIRVSLSSSVTYGAPVFMDLASGASAGTFAASPSATTVMLPLSKAKWVSYDDTKSTGILALSL